MSSFQTLPYLVIEKIVAIHFYAYDNLLYTIKENLSYWKFLAPLSWLCQSWRLVALQYMLRSYQIRIGKFNISKEMRIWHKDLALPVPSVVPLVKIIHVNIEYLMARINADQFCNRDGPYESVYSLIVTLCYYPDWEQNRETALANIPRLTHFLQELAPNIKDIEIVDKTMQGEAFDVYYMGLYKNLLCSLIACFAKRKMKVSSQNIFDFWDMEIQDNIGDSITHFELPTEYLFDEFKFIRRCAKTVQVLRLGEVVVRSDIVDLFVDDVTGYHVVYPNLTYLEANFPSGFVSDKQRLISPEAISFPNLQRLVLRDGYPFKDNVLFRGNQHSLQSIDITLSDPSVTQLIYYHLFSTANNYENLNNVRIIILCRYHRHDEPFELIRENSRDSMFLTYMCPCVDVSTMRFVAIGFDSLYSVRILDIGITRFSLSDLIDLVKQLSHLTELVCYVAHMHELPNSLTPLKCHKYLVSEYYPLNTNLEVLLINISASRWEEIQVRCVLQLVILCPSINVVMFNCRRFFRDFKEYWDKMLQQKMYRDYADRLQSIRISHWT